MPVTSANGAASSQSRQYINVGLNSSFVVTFGKSLLIHTDENGDVFLLVKREES